MFYHPSTEDHLLCAVLKSRIESQWCVSVKTRGYNDGGCGSILLKNSALNRVALFSPNFRVTSDVQNLTWPARIESNPLSCAFDFR